MGSGSGLGRGSRRGARVRGEGEGAGGRWAARRASGATARNLPSLKYAGGSTCHTRASRIRCRLPYGNLLESPYWYRVRVRVRVGVRVRVRLEVEPPAAAEDARALPQPRRERVVGVRVQLRVRIRPQVPISERSRRAAPRLAATSHHLAAIELEHGAHASRAERGPRRPRLLHARQRLGVLPALSAGARLAHAPRMRVIRPAQLHTRRAAMVVLHNGAAEGATDAAAAIIGPHPLQPVRRTRRGKQRRELRRAPRLVARQWGQCATRKRRQHRTQVTRRADLAA